MLRVISGIYKGRKLKQPDLKITRATTDIAKEAIFSMLHKKTKGAIILDLFAGSGSLSIEALSRGEMKALIVEKNLEPIRIIKENLNALKIKNYSIFRMDAMSFLRMKKGAQFDIIFVDPPYADESIYFDVLSRIIDNKQLNYHGLIIMEMDKNKLINLPKGLTIHREKVFGIAKILFLSKIH